MDTNDLSVKELSLIYTLAMGWYLPIEGHDKNWVSIRSLKEKERDENVIRTLQSLYNRGIAQDVPESSITATRLTTQARLWYESRYPTEESIQKDLTRHRRTLRPLLRDLGPS